MTQLFPAPHCSHTQLLHCSPNSQELFCLQSGSSGRGSEASAASYCSGLDVNQDHFSPVLPAKIAWLPLSQQDPQPLKPLPSPGKPSLQAEG